MQSASKILLGAITIGAAAILFNTSSPVESKAAKTVAPRKPTPPAFVSSTVVLPDGDGRVHVVTIPGQFDISKCAVLVAPTGSTVSCIQTTDDPPLMYGHSSNAPEDFSP